MHYYQFHIGDYASHTRHLSLMEDLAYRRLLDFYYLHEQPIKQRDIARQIGMREHEQDVLTVLNEFFISGEEGFVSPRADKEIQQYKEFIEAGKRGAAKRWAKAGDSPPNSPPNAGPIATNNHNPLTITHKPKKEQQRGSRLPADFFFPKEWCDFCADQRSDLNPQKVFDEFKDYWVAQPGQKGVKTDWAATWRNWVRRQSAPKQSFAQQAADIARTTVPSKLGPDPALLKIEQDRQKAAPMPEHIRAQINQVLRKA
jgi:uncharacterized protein YdaU (DUF1376 family)